MKRILPLLLLPACLWSPSSHAGGYPDRYIKILIPFTAGGAVDNIVRAMSPELSADLGQPIVVENKPGGGAQVAATALLQAPADGYTLLAAPGGVFALNPHLYKQLAYDPRADFEGIATLTTAPMVMFSNPKGRIPHISAFRTALANGDFIKYASPGQGTAPHLFGHMIGAAFPKANLLHVPYRGAPQAIQAVLSQEVDLMFDAVPTVVGLVRNGQVRPLAIAAEHRHPLFPETPTLRELGMPQISMDFWVGVVARKGTPAAVVDRLHAAFQKALDTPAIARMLQDRGYTRLTMSPREFDGLIRSELEKYGPIVKATGATID
ncbi:MULTISPECIES: tripartite tricarboxylate transporter substrate binding protein [Pigmentiphaga]|uniref:Tripartite tricarboxylate transporter substrate binding protein n=1 Tax=Pigmentiphaga daeguensis TaxID=414049 RepID=A0ABP3N4V6_9BURK